MTFQAALHHAQIVDNDEFYTFEEDVKKELVHYFDVLKGKIVYCPCDSPDSAFTSFLLNQANQIGLKEFHATNYVSSQLDLFQGEIHDRFKHVKWDDTDWIEITTLDHGGNFLTDPLCQELLDTCDVVITNPPFSLIQSFVGHLLKHKKDFLLVCPIPNMFLKGVFPLWKNNSVRYGINHIKEFRMPDDTTKSFGNVGWFTTLDHGHKPPFLELTASYDPENVHKKFDLYNAINVDRVRDIPKNYKDLMGVPISFISKYNPDQFSILDLLHHSYGGLPSVDGEDVFQRLIVRNKHA